MSEQKDRDVIRKLLTEVKEIADSGENQEKIEGWKKINSLQRHRPMLWITEIPWGEFENNIDELKPLCESKNLREWERHIRRQLFTLKHLPCDEVATGVHEVHKVITGKSGFGVETKEQQIAQGDSYITSHHYEPVIKDFEDIEKIQMPEITGWDEETTLKNKESAEELLGDIMEVRVSGPIRSQVISPWDNIVRWTGVTEALIDLVARPDYIHALVRRITDSFLAHMEQYEKLNLLAYPHPLLRVVSGAASFTDELPQKDYDPEHIRLIDQWGGATCQIFGSVSPEMHEEFALKYENEVMEQCGLNYYGCCEPLHNKMHLMAKVPRLRKISISPWCDVAMSAENAVQKYVFSHKPSPAILAEDKFNVERAEKDLRNRLEQSEDMPCEIIMKDISTVRGDVDRVIAWCEMAYRVARDSK